ncbi:MAG TPA: hypothetical protein P5533_09115, partial [Candidatus Cloacimonadota bacterium]|nr:hypothetical protein [Candidatus Cloacimonadota bacterium]
MTKELILLATSKKYGKYCVAGIDTKTGNWIRLVSHNSDAHYAIDAKDLVLDNGCMAQKLDIVELELTDRAISYFQTENYIIRKNSVWHYKGKSSIAEVSVLHPPNRQEFIFYDTSRKLAKAHYARLPLEQIYSLLLITPDKAEVEITQREQEKRVTLKL